MPKAADSVKVNYHGWLDGGKVFDSSYERQEPDLVSPESSHQGLD